VKIKHLFGLLAIVCATDSLSAASLSAAAAGSTAPGRRARAAAVPASLVRFPVPSIVTADTQAYSSIVAGDPLLAILKGTCKCADGALQNYIRLGGSAGASDQPEEARQWEGCSACKELRQIFDSVTKKQLVQLRNILQHTVLTGTDDEKFVQLAHILSGWAALQAQSKTTSSGASARGSAPSTYPVPAFIKTYKNYLFVAGFLALATPTFVTQSVPLTVNAVVNFVTTFIPARLLVRASGAVLLAPWIYEQVTSKKSSSSSTP